MGAPAPPSPAAPPPPCESMRSNIGFAGRSGHKLDMEKE
eukprot:gene4465-738_t